LLIVLLIFFYDSKSLVTKRKVYQKPEMKLKLPPTSDDSEGENPNEPPLSPRSRKMKKEQKAREKEREKAEKEREKAEKEREKAEREKEKAAEKEREKSEKKKKKEEESSSSPLGYLEAFLFLYIFSGLVSHFIWNRQQQ